MAASKITEYPWLCSHGKVPFHRMCTQSLWLMKGLLYRIVSTLQSAQYKSCFPGNHNVTMTGVGLKHVDVSSTKEHDGCLAEVDALRYERQPCRNLTPALGCVRTSDCPPHEEHDPNLQHGFVRS